MGKIEKSYQASFLKVEIIQLAERSQKIIFSWVRQIFGTMNLIPWWDDKSKRHTYTQTNKRGEKQQESGCGCTQLSLFISDGCLDGCCSHRLLSAQPLRSETNHRKPAKQLSSCLLCITTSNSEFKNSLIKFLNINLLSCCLEIQGGPCQNLLNYFCGL